MKGFLGVRDSAYHALGMRGIVLAADFLCVIALAVACDGISAATGDASAADASSDDASQGGGMGTPEPGVDAATGPSGPSDDAGVDGGGPPPDTIGNACTSHSECLDGKFCNGPERCGADGRCQAGTPPEVDDGVQCTTDKCNESTGRVVHTPDDSVCDDGEACTRDTCDLTADCRNVEDFSACTCEPVGACDPFDADPCPGGACRPTVGGTVCETPDAPVLAEGDSCAVPDEDACPAGTLCVDIGGGQRCHRLCRAGTVGTCGATLACSTSALFTDACVRLCRPFPEPCDILAQDCVDMTDTCTLATHPETGENYTGCRPAGTQQRGDACGPGSGTCGHGLICVSRICREVCDPMDGDPDCTDAGEACTGVSATYDVPYCEP